MFLTVLEVRSYLRTVVYHGSSWNDSTVMSLDILARYVAKAVVFVLDHTSCIARLHNRLIGT